MMFGKEKEIKIIVIDDNENAANSTITTLKNAGIENKLKVDIREPIVLNVDEDEYGIDGLIEIILEFFGKAKNKVLIIDFVLSSKIARYGSSLALRLREEEDDQQNQLLKEVPLVGITSRLKLTTDLRSMEFIDIFDRENMDKFGAEEVLRIAVDYPIILKYQPTEGSSLSKKVLQEIFCEEKTELLWSSLPEDIKKKWDKDTNHLFARWIWTELIQQPGFLYDRLYAATLLGITEAGFKEIEDRLSNVLYKGVFSSNSNPRWWKDQLIDFITAEIEPDKVLPIWKRGHLFLEKYLGVNENYILRCSITDDSETKLVRAFIDEERREMDVFKYELTEDDPNEPIRIGFEVSRIFRGE